MKSQMRRQSPSRKLTSEEEELWNRVKRTAVPFRTEIYSDKAVGSDQAMPAPEKAGFSPAAAPARPTKTRVASRPNPGYLDRRTKTKIARGRSEIDGVLDLHGMRQDEAHRALRSFLQSSQRRGARFVIVITGKGTRDGFAEAAGNDHFSPRGILRQAVPHWLSTEGFRDMVVAYSNASQHHGGGGALYIQIRAPLPRRTGDGR